MHQPALKMFFGSDAYLLFIGPNIKCKWSGASRCMPNAAPHRFMQQPLGQRIVISNELATFLRMGRIETRLHVSPSTARTTFIIKPRKVAVPETLPVCALFTPSGAFSGWFEVLEHRPNTYAIVDEACREAYPLFPCSSGNVNCTAVFFSATSCCDACASTFCPMHITRE